jgi:GAF domain-containing protein
MGVLLRTAVNVSGSDVARRRPGAHSHGILLCMTHTGPEPIRSREDLLRVLLDTAADLTALRDVEAVLQAIVRRTRTIVGADMAYVSLNDPARGDTYIRQSDGVVTAAYRTLRMPLGTGVLGQVATGLAPYQSADYLADETLVHVPDVDEIVRAEGVHAIMGAPLTVAGRVIGALTVAERRPRRFSAEEVAVVDSIGTHAAVALDNSMRFEQMERLAEDLVHRERRGAEELALVAQVLDLDRRLLEAVTVARDVRHVLAVGRGVLGCELTLAGADGAELAATGPAAPGDGGSEGGGGTTVAVTAASEELGSLRTPVVLAEHDVALLERIAAHAALALLFARADDDADLRQQSDLLDDLLEGRDVPPERLERRMQHWGLHPDDRLWCVALGVPPGDSRQRLQALRTLGLRAVMVAHRDHVCLVTADPRWERAVRRLFASQGWPLRAGLGGPAEGVRGLDDAHRSAGLALGSLEALGRDDVLDGADLGMLGALLDLDRRGELPRSLTAGVAPLVEHDRARGTDLVRTAFHYLESDGSAARTGELLHLHRNTVRQRLDRITALLGAGWDASPRRLDTHLALRVLHERDDLRR